jgi:hypothetical protein
MLKKNVYITYPAGYMGTYLNWMIHASEQDLAKETVVDPVTEVSNAHRHIKFPTHLSWAKALTWIAYNKPTKNLVYALNARKHKDYHLTPEYAIQNIMRMDENPVFINCHDEDDADTVKFGALNMFTKWPTFLSAIGVWHNEYNPATDSDSKQARNWLIDNWQKESPGNSKINPDIILYNLKGHRDWFDIRKKTAPLEMTTEQYLIPDGLPEHLYNVSIKDIIQKDFPRQFEDLVKSADLGDFNFDHCKAYHETFLSKQTNIKWFEAVEKFRTTKTVDPWFYDNALSQAFLLLEIGKDKIEDLLFLDTEEIVNKFTV